VNYYNENDPSAAQWLRNLILLGLIPPGDVDTRSIADVQPDDLAGYAQVHFFAGIGGWSYALQIAGWPADRPIWTGSCPCQPFSVAGRGAGTSDERHLWPHMFRLVRAARPAVVLGEQVAGSAGYGWFDGVSADLEREGYACRAVDIPACAVNAPHIRQRLYWCAVGDAVREPGRVVGGSVLGAEAPRQQNGRDATDSADVRMEHTDHERREEQRGVEPIRAEQRGVERPDGGGNVADPASERGERGGQRDAGLGRGQLPSGGHDSNGGGQWDAYTLIACHDGKTRRAQPAIPLLVDGFPGRVAAWHGFGNAIVPPLAAEVIKALMETLP
jgi:DNA (cytosine-5)-methyltransferase 1